MTQGQPYEYYRRSADFILERIGFVPEIGIVLGTGCSSLARDIQDAVEIPYADIPNFLVATNPSHAGIMIAGTLEGRKVICMNGRFHLYEGYSFDELATPVIVLSLVGIKSLVLTNASGAVNRWYRPGDVMIIRDHIKLFGDSPVRGMSDPRLGPRFFSMCDVYQEKLVRIARKCARKTTLHVHEGVYMFFPGPQFESPAEIRAARRLGADVIGMSTVTEVITAAKCSLPVLGIALVSNMAAGVIKGNKALIDFDDVNGRVEGEFCRYLRSIVRALPKYNQ